jgi:hypothetical protein
VLHEVTTRADVALSAGQAADGYFNGDGATTIAGRCARDREWK